MPARKRSIDEAQSQHSANTSNTYPPSDGFVNADTSNPPKKQRAGLSSRTGQACDRCKARKIRCDDTIGGCMPCRQNNTECTTTDRITNRAQVRGHTEALEQETAILRTQVLELKQQLKENGIDPRPSTGQPTWASYHDSRTSGKHSAEGHPRRTAEANIFASQPHLRTGPVADNYLGVSSAHGALGALSHVKGTILSVFGMEVDLADYVSDAVVNRQYSCMTYDNLQTQLYFNCAQKLGGTPPPLARLPDTYDGCMNNAQIYFDKINPWVPVLHKTDFYQLVANFYKENFQPSAAETVMMHMVLAILKFQHAIRNSNALGTTEHVREQSFAHYNWALQHFPHLIQHPNLATMQAMTLICTHLRSFPKPGAAWMMTHWTMAVLLDQNLHRSASAIGACASELSVQDIEMRKRVFWSVLAMRVSLSGKLGRPIELRRQDFDIELPEPLDDNLPSEKAAPAGNSNCSFRSAIETFKLVRLFLDTYNAIYALHPSPDYESTLHEIESQHEEVKKELSQYQLITKTENSSSPDYVFALWIQFWNAELTITLHHPAVCRSSNPEIIASNLQKCVKASFLIIETVAKLRTAKSLDATWLNATTYIAAAFTLLFAFWGRRDYVSSQDITKLKKDLDLFIDILQEVGALLGTGKELPNRISAIITTWLTKINKYMADKTTSPTAVHTSIKQERSQTGSSLQGTPTSFRGSMGFQPPQLSTGTSAGSSGFSDHPKSLQSPAEFTPQPHPMIMPPRISQSTNMPFDPYGPTTSPFAAQAPPFDARTSLFANTDQYYPTQGQPTYGPTDWQTFTRQLKEEPSFEYQSASDGMGNVGVPAGNEANMTSPLAEGFHAYPNQSVGGVVQQQWQQPPAMYDPLRDPLPGRSGGR